MNSMRLTERQVRALWRSTWFSNTMESRMMFSSEESLTPDEMTDLEARLYVASHPETVAHIVGMEVE